MIIYSATKQGFIQDVVANRIDTRIKGAMIRETGHSVSPREVTSWINSMQFMRNVIDDDEIPNEAGIAIEYMIPQTSKRIDFIITGLDQEKQKNAVVVELKQWEKVQAIEETDMDGVVVETYVGGGQREVSHPSYQVWSYVTFLEDYNSGIQDGEINLDPCAYLHNYKEDEDIKSKQYQKYIKKAPLFFKGDEEKLTNFIKAHVKYGGGNILYEIENGKIRPSKALADSLASMLNGNKEFILLDEQKVVYEKVLYLAKLAETKGKQVLIIEGGPGTGKSVVAINLLSEFTNRQKVVQYVTKNSAPREVFSRKLAEGGHARVRIQNMFKGSGSYTKTEVDLFDVLLVDEAHRLNERSGLYGNLGVNQIKEIIDSAKLAVFFIDEDQRVTLKDIGSKEEIKKWAKKADADVLEMNLESQFRCNGSDGYLAWLDDVLQIRKTANYTLDDIDYNFGVYDNPKVLHSKIINKNKINNKSRVIAGYTWKWISKKEPILFDIEIGNYKARWNLMKHGQAWIIHPNSVNEVGCIHTCQGLELDYVGVIIGSDLIVRDEKIITDYRERATSDQSLKGIKKIAKEKGEEYAQRLAEPIIKNTYRTLMTRGMKGCYIFSEDEETREYFRNRFSKDPESYGVISDGASIM